MPLALQPRETVRAAIRRNVRKRIGRALELLDAGVDADTGERIHEARKQLKQVRALLRLIRPEVGRKRCARADRRLRKVARALSGARDATVLLETFLQFGPRARLTPASLARFRLTLEFHRNRAHEDLVASSRHRGHLQDILRGARKAILNGPAIAGGWRAIGPGLGKIYRWAAAAATVTAGKDAPDDAALHETRKRSKDLFHVLEFIGRMGPGTVGDRIRIAHRLTELLGKDHDLAVLEAVLEGPLRRQLSVFEVRRLLRIVAAQRKRLQHRASAACATLYGSDEAAFVKEIHGSWKQWRAAR